MNKTEGKKGAQVADDCKNTSGGCVHVVKIHDESVNYVLCTDGWKFNGDISLSLKFVGNYRTKEGLG